MAPVSEVDALELVATRQGQALGEDVLVSLGPRSRDRPFGWRTDYGRFANARLANVRPVIVAAPGHQEFGSRWLRRTAPPSEPRAGLHF